MVSFDGFDGESIAVEFDLSAEIDDIALVVVSLSDLQVDANVNVSLGSLEIISVLDGTLNELLGNTLWLVNIPCNGQKVTINKKFLNTYLSFALNKF